MDPLRHRGSYCADRNRRDLGVGSKVLLPFMIVGFVLIAVTFLFFLNPAVQVATLCHLPASATTAPATAHSPLTQRVAG
jgi:hypothetical protein